MDRIHVNPDSIGGIAAIELFCAALPHLQPYLIKTILVYANDKMKHLFSTKPFRHKLFLYYALVGFVVVLIFSTLLISITSRLNNATEVYHQKQLHAANLSELEQILERVEQLSSQVIDNNELLNFFVLLSSDDDDSNYFENNLLDGIRA